VADGAVELEAAVLDDRPVGVPRPGEEEEVEVEVAEVEVIEVEVERREGGGGRGAHPLLSGAMLS